MGECNLDKIEWADFDDGSPENVEEVPSHWEILTRNANILWRCEIPCTGENGNAISSDYDHRRARQW
jgi:hypothetical protein